MKIWILNTIIENQYVAYILLWLGLSFLCTWKFFRIILTLVLTNLKLRTDKKKSTSIIINQIWVAKRPQRGHKETLEVMDVYYLDCSDSNHAGCVHMSKRIKLYTLNNTQFLYINYTSVKLFFLMWVAKNMFTMQISTSCTDCCL